MTLGVEKTLQRRVCTVFCALAQVVFVKKGTSDASIREYAQKSSALRVDGALVIMFARLLAWHYRHLPGMPPLDSSILTDYAALEDQVPEEVLTHCVRLENDAEVEAVRAADMDGREGYARTFHGGHDDPHRECVPNQLMKCRSIGADM